MLTGHVSEEMLQLLAVSREPERPAPLPPLPSLTPSLPVFMQPFFLRLKASTFVLCGCWPPPLFKDALYWGLRGWHQDVQVDTCKGKL